MNLLVSRLVLLGLLIVAIRFIYGFFMVVVRDNHSSYGRGVVDTCNIINGLLNVVYTLRCLRVRVVPDW